MKAYIEFLRYCLNDKGHLPKSAKDIVWTDLMLWATQQAIVGVIFVGILRAGKAIEIPFDTLMEWIGFVHKIELQNTLVNCRCSELTEQLGKDGFDSCVLKGQGNALMYPVPLMRTPGDIDVWLRQKGVKADSYQNTESVIEYAKKKDPNNLASGIHAQYGNYGGVDVELHFMPTYASSPIYLRRLRKWWQGYEDEVFTNRVSLPDDIGEICVPTLEFNLVFQISHLYKHVIASGVGFRQIIDYYYLLKSMEGIPKPNVGATLKYLGLYDFACGVMYVLHHVLDMDVRYLIAPIDKKRGEFILKEILRGGNFGKYNTRETLVKPDNSAGSLLWHIGRDFRLVRYFPSETLWEPFSRIYHHFWRKKHN